MGMVGPAVDVVVVVVIVVVLVVVMAIERCEILKKAAAAIDGIPAPPDDDPINGDGRWW